MAKKTKAKKVAEAVARLRIRAALLTAGGQHAEAAHILVALRAALGA